MDVQGTVLQVSRQTKCLTSHSDTDETEADPSGGAALIVCDVQNNIYTCGINSTSCLDSSSTFVMTDAVDLLLRPTMVAKLEGATSSAMTIAPTDTLTVASASSTSGSTNADAATVTITATATANSSDSPSKSLGNDQYSVGAVAGAAVGVGIPLLIALVGAILVILNQRKQLRRTGGEAYSDNAKPHGYSPPSGYVPVSPSKHQRGMSNGGYVESKPSAAAYYAPAPQHSPPLHSMTSTVPPQAGHFREMVPTVGMGEMDTERERQELDGGMANAVSRTQTEE